MYGKNSEIFFFFKNIPNNYWTTLACTHTNTHTDTHTHTHTHTHIYIYIYQERQTNLLKAISTYTLGRCGQLLTGHQWQRIKYEGFSYKVSLLPYGCTAWMEKNLDRNYTRTLPVILKKILEGLLCKTSNVQPFTFYLTNHTN